MEIIIYAVSGIIAGAIIVWFIAKSSMERTASQLRMDFSKQAADIEAKAKSAEAVVNELRQQVQQKETEINKARNELVFERQAKVEALTKLDAAQKNFEEQKALIEAMRTEMTDTFNALSSAALKSSSEDFLRLASEHLGKVVADTEGKLGKHQAAIDGLVNPLHEALRKYEEQIHIIERRRGEDYASLSKHIEMLASTHQQLQRETSNLVTALRKPQVRGRWGEMQLRRVAELSGMSEHCDFTEQQSVDTEKGRIRPDMVVHLPMNREIVVDSKVSLDAYLDALSCPDEDGKKLKLEKHTQQVRAHMNKLSSKEYWSQFKQSPEFVVLFIPGESFLSAALDIDNTLIEEGIQKRVIIATPTTFIALLRAIAYGWRQEQITKNAQEISLLGKELYERIAVMARHFNDLATAIERSVLSYNKIAGSMEMRVLPSVRKFKELGATGAEDIPALEQIDQSPRNLSLLPDEN